MAIGILTLKGDQVVDGKHGSGKIIILHDIDLGGWLKYQMLYFLIITRALAASDVSKHGNVHSWLFRLAFPESLILGEVRIPFLSTT
jgi:hypothetical protein